MNRGLRIGLLGIVFLAQLAVPGWMLGGRELALQKGAAYKFRTAPVDPVDAFRGRYVALRFEESTAVWGEPGRMPDHGNTPIFISLTVDNEGFAHLDRATRRPPATGDYIRVTLWQVGEGMVYLELPFDRYYMNEEKAPKAEQAYWENNTRTNHNAYVTVRVHKGTAVIEQLYIADQPIEDFIAAQP